MHCFPAVQRTSLFGNQKEYELSGCFRGPKTITPEMVLKKMELEDFARISRIPLALLKKIARAGIVEIPLSENDILGLRFLEKIRENNEICKVLFYRHLVKKSKKARVAYLNTFDLETKWERFVFSRFFNYRAEEKGGRNLKMSKVIEDLKNYLNFEPNYFQIKRLYSVRKKAYRLRAEKKRDENSLPKQRIEQKEITK